MDSTTKFHILWRLLSDVAIIGTGGVILLLFRVLGSPYKRGFFCDDESLMHPFHESSVTSGLLYGLGFTVTIVLMVAVEAMAVYGMLNNGHIRRQDVTSYGQMRVLLMVSYVSISQFMFGVVVEHIIADCAKYGIGRLRPHFFDVCNLNMSTIDCSAGYITEFQCSGDENRIREVRLSFPSGHSSFSSYVAVYLMIYLQKRIKLKLFRLVRPLLQMILFSLAWYTALSRISDYKHHPGDVFGGAVIGSVTAILVTLFVSDLFRPCDGQPACKKRYGSMNTPRDIGSIQDTDPSPRDMSVM